MPPCVVLISTGTSVADFDVVPPTVSGDAGRKPVHASGGTRLDQLLRELFRGRSSGRLVITSKILFIPKARSITEETAEHTESNNKDIAAYCCHYAVSVRSADKWLRIS